MAPRESPRPSPRHARPHGKTGRKSKHKKRKSQSRRPNTASDESREELRSHSLSAGALAALNKENARRKRKPEAVKKVSRDQYRELRRDAERTPDRARKRHQQRKKRVVSGAMMEEGRIRRGGLRGGGRWSDEGYEKQDFYHRRRPTRSRKRLWFILAGVLALVIVIVVVAVVVSQKNKSGGKSHSGSSGLSGQDRSSIPTKWQNTYLDPWSWTTTEDFNVTFTDETVGDLPIMGLYSDWDDSKRANDNVPPLDKSWGSYSDKPARGVNLGGWLSLEPFITPSLFDYAPEDGVIDEYTLCQKLGSDATSILEKHYANFVTEDTFKDIQDAGLDHVRIPYSYWAIEIYDGDPYVFRTSWRYLLRAIEWARKYGIRVNLDIHGLPGSQNGWNHSGRYGSIGWLNGTDGSLNAKRSLEIHDRLSKFFAQDRYKNIISHYGLCNEPKMTALQTSDVIQWSEEAYAKIRKNGIKALIVFGDGFMGLDNWQGLMTGYDDMVLDVHQYVIFNVAQIPFTHKEKIEYACEDWSKQAVESLDTSTGYGPTLFAEWSQADTDCAKDLIGVGYGTRWEGTYDKGGPHCPTKDSKCSCEKANADPSDYSDEYRKFLQMFAEAQMHSFEKGWGWWYWTWKTESAPLWSYESGLKAGILPKKAYDRDFNCDSDIPDFEGDGLPEYY